MFNYLNGHGFLILLINHSSLVKCMLKTQYSAVKVWTVSIAILLLLAFAFLPVSFMSDYFLMLWAMTAFAAFWRARHMQASQLSKHAKIAVLSVGIIFFILSFALIPLGIGRAPYSLDDFTLLLVGLSLIFFAYYGHSVLIPPTLIPAVVVMGYQLLGGRPSEWFKPLLQPTIDLLMLSLSLTGFSPDLTGNRITYLTAVGNPIRVAIVPDCTGIWSLIAYGVSVGIILLLLPKIKAKGYLLILLGFPITYLLNIVRLSMILWSVYYLGPEWIEPAHMNTGWIVFSIWMLIFWYVFFSLRLYERKASDKQPVQ